MLTSRLSQDICRVAATAETQPLIGVVKGEGIGPDVTQSACRVLDAVAAGSGISFEVRLFAEGDATVDGARPDIGSVTQFCRDVFKDGGVVLAGAMGGRHVYDLRQTFDLYCKLVPLVPAPVLRDRLPSVATEPRTADILLVRENVGGLYQGASEVDRSDPSNRIAVHRFAYREEDIRRLLRIALGLAGARRGELTVIIKDGGAPALSAVWREIATEMAGASGVQLRFMNVDHAVYEWLTDPHQFDVVASPNLFGDILADLGGVLVGSRGVTFSGNFSAEGAAIFQTNHGAGEDLRGQDVANPVGQILSLAMLLRESFGMLHEAAAIEQAIYDAWSAGWRTPDVAEEESRTVGTLEMTTRIVEALRPARVAVR